MEETKNTLGSRLNPGFRLCKKKKKHFENTKVTKFVMQRQKKKKKKNPINMKMEKKNVKKRKKQKYYF